MLIKEAQWLGQKIMALNSDELFPMINVGSSTEDFRTVEQPWIYNHIFKELDLKGYKIIHSDIKEGAGIDLIGNFSDLTFLQNLSQKADFKSILCTNFFEHVENRQEIAQLLVKAVPKNGYIILSGPYDYPYHEDPIDTMYRPTVKEMSSLFPGTTYVDGAIISDYSYLYYLLRKPAKKISKLFNRDSSIEDSAGTHNKASKLSRIKDHIPYLFKPFKVTCVVLQKV